MDRVRQLILDRLAELGLDRKEISKAIGRNPTYLSQYIVRGSPKQLPEEEREKLAAILKVSPDALRASSGSSPAGKAEKKSDATRNSLVAERPAAHYAEGGEGNFVSGTDLFGSRLDLPVFGTAEGGQGALLVSDAAVDYVARPPVLLRVQDGYGMIVTGESMIPEHKPGAVALVNPHIPPRVGDSCVFRSHNHGTNLAMIKEYRGQTATHWKVHQHNPPKDFTLDKREWQVCHKVVGNYFP
jgi:phage repressor protein C with HTH and peptisase S24 domain